MAKITKTNAQEDALKKINSDLKLLVGVNAVINSKADTGSMTISFGKAKASIPMSRDESDEVMAGIRKKLTSEVRSLSKKYAIVLDENDEAVLSNSEGQEKTSDKPEVVAQEHDSAGNAELTEVDTDTDEAEPAGEETNRNFY